MEYRNLGKSGLKVSCLCLGTDNFGNPTSEAEAVRIIAAALDGGINLIDTADLYAAGESERILGRALKASGRRDQVVLASKAHYPTGPGPNDRGNSRLHLMRACEDSLRRLQTDVIDLYQLHRPDFDVPLDETLRALDDLVRQGKIRYIGSSTAPAWHIMEAIMVSELRGFVRFVSEQSPYNLLDRRIENELLPMIRRQGLGLITWSPLAMGMLAGRYSKGQAPPTDSRAVLRGGIYAERVTPRGVEVGNRFASLAREHAIPPAQLAVLWVKDQPGVTAPIIGPRTLDQLMGMLPVAEMQLSHELRVACDDLSAPGGVIASFFNSAPWMSQRVV
jgi:aryl-alcohol dehydrogenase-like predicted oxidoreductase